MKEKGKRIPTYRGIPLHIFSLEFSSDFITSAGKMGELDTPMREMNFTPGDKKNEMPFLVMSYILYYSRPKFTQFPPLAYAHVSLENLDSISY